MAAPATSGKSGDSVRLSPGSLLSKSPCQFWVNAAALTGYIFDPDWRCVLPADWL
jgi:hypothetical protein